MKLKIIKLFTTTQKLESVEEYNKTLHILHDSVRGFKHDFDNIFNKGISGKENHSGLGLWEIRQILKKNNNINLHTTKNDKYFSQQLEIYY